MNCRVDKYRRCIVYNTRRAIFHEWAHYTQNLTSPFTYERGDFTEYTVAIVEYEDGTIDEVKPKNVRFIDGISNGFADIAHRYSKQED